MKDIHSAVRAAREAQRLARRQRAESRSLRAWMRAQWLAGRAVVQKCRELRARLQAEQLIARVRASARREA